MKKSITKQNSYIGLAILAMLAATGCGKKTNAAQTTTTIVKPLPGVVPPPRTVYINNKTVVIIYAGCPNGWAACYQAGSSFIYWNYNSWINNSDPVDYGYYGDPADNGNTGTGNNTGNGTGSGTGNGSGNGSGSGTGTGNGSGNGSGSGTGTGNGSGNGSGSGTGTGNGSGNGSGSGTGTGNGSGNGSGSGTGNGSGNGSGYNTSGSGNTSGNGSGWNFTVGDFVSGTDAIQLPDGNGGTMVCEGTNCTDSNNSAAAATGNGFANSVGGDTKDVDLQRSDFQNQGLTVRAQAFASQFQMDFDKAVVLTQLADKVQALTLRGEMTAQERETIVNGALGAGKIESDEVNSAIAAIAQHGDQTAMNNLMEKAAKNLGMPSSAGLRDQLLPALGIQF